MSFLSWPSRGFTLWKFLFSLLTAALLVAGILVFSDLRVAATQGSGFAAKMACSAVFVSGRDLDEFMRLELADAAFSTMNLEQLDNSIRASAIIGDPRTAYYRPGKGCTLLDSEADQAPSPQATADTHKPTPLPKQVDKRIQAVVSGEVDAPATGTQALLVWRDGKIIAEGYQTPGGREVPLIGWSMTKSLMHAVVGVMVQQGRISLEDNALFEHWRNDERSAISLEDLLRMQSGLAFDELYEPGHGAVQMLFAEASAGQFAADAELIHKPGSHWYYSSGTTNIIALLLQQKLGEQRLADYFQQELLQPLGITSLVIEPDPSGVPVGSSFGYATATDWLRFGLLYLRDGNWQGEQLLPPNWAKLARSPTTDSDGDYGQHFWINQPNSEAKKHYPNLPDDAYLMSGFNGQIVAILPSDCTVIVRLGYSPNRSFDLNDLAGRILKKH